jgi:Flp pilus assembly protein TadD
MKASLLRILLAPLLILFAAATFAVDISGPANDKLSAARAKIAAKDWPGAVEELKRVNDTANADWNNLMGYSLRKAGAANASESERYYNEALRIDPKHKGALEYSGELYLMMGNLPAAEQRLACPRQSLLPAVQRAEGPEERGRQVQGQRQQIRGRLVNRPASCHVARRARTTALSGR